MAISSIQDLISALPSAKRIFLGKDTATTDGAGKFHSTWTLTGRPGAGAAAGSLNGAVCTSSTTGAIPLSNAAAGNALHLAGVEVVNGSERVILSLFDRVYHQSALDFSSTSAQSITSPAWTRHTDGVGLEIWLECYSPWGATGYNLTVNYTDENAAASSSVVAMAADAPVAGTAYPIPLATGDTGVKSITSVQLSASSGSAGNGGITVCKRLCDISIPASSTRTMDWSQLGLAQVPNSACLFGILWSQAASVPALMCNFMLAEG